MSMINYILGIYSKIHAVVGANGKYSAMASLVAANLTDTEKVALEDFAITNKKATYHTGKTDPSCSDFVPLGVTMPYSDWDWTDPLMYILVGNKYFTDFPELRKELDEHRDEIRLACIDNIRPPTAKMRKFVTIQPAHLTTDGRLKPVVHGILRMAFYMYTEKWVYAPEVRTDRMLHSMSDPCAKYYEVEDLTRKPLW